MPNEFCLWCLYIWFVCSEEVCKNGYTCMYWICTRFVSGLLLVPSLSLSVAALSLSFSSRLSVLFTYFSLFTQRDFVAAMRITASVSTRFIQNGYVKNASVYAWTFCTNYTQVVCKGHLPNFEPQSLWTITFEW